MSRSARVVELGPPLLLGLAPLIFLRTGGEFENHPKTAFLQWGIALVALLWLGRQGAIRGRTPIDVPVLSFYLVCWLSLVQAVNVFEAWPTLLHWGAAVILYVVLVQSLRGPVAVPRFFLAAALGSGAVCLIGISQAVLDLDWIPQSAVPGSTFSNRNMAAHYVAICFPLALGLIVVGRRVRDRGLGVACLALSLVYLWYTRTHSAWLAVLVVIVLSAVGVPWIMRRAGSGRRPTRLILALAVLVLVLLASFVGLYSAADGLEGEGEIVRRLGSIADASEGTAGLRLIFWKNTLAMVRDHPWLGVGLGNFKLHYPLYHRAVELDWTFDEEHQLERTHNDHLQILAEVGLLGLVAWISIFVAAFYVAWICLRARKGWIPTQAFFVCLGIVSFLVVACFSFPMERAIPPVYLFALLGLLGFLHFETSGTPEERGRLASGMRRAFVVLLVAFLATSVHFAQKAVRTDVYYTKGVQRTNAGEHEKAVRLLERARRLSPRDANVLLALAGNHTSMGRCELALGRLREVLELHPHKVNAISNTGYCYLQRQDYREAERYFLMTLELIPDSPETHTNLSTVHFMQGKHDLAVDAYRQAIELSKTKLFLPSVRTEARFLQPRLLLANVLVAQERLDEAIEQYEEILARNPSNPDVRRLLRELYRTIGEPEKARALLGDPPQAVPR